MNKVQSFCGRISARLLLLLTLALSVMMASSARAASSIDFDAVGGELEDTIAAGKAWVLPIVFGVTILFVAIRLGKRFFNKVG